MEERIKQHILHRGKTWNICAHTMFSMGTGVPKLVCASFVVHHLFFRQKLSQQVQNSSVIFFSRIPSIKLWNSVRRVTSSYTGFRVKLEYFKANVQLMTFTYCKQRKNKTCLRQFILGPKLKIPKLLLNIISSTWNTKYRYYHFQVNVCGNFREYSPMYSGREVVAGRYFEVIIFCLRNF